MEKNLAGIKVLDFTRVLVGPYLTQILVDNGAEVIKIEKPFTGADERSFAPIMEGENGTQSGYFIMLNRGKKSVALDLKNPDDKEVIYKLMEWADVICENFAPGVLKKLGFGYEEAKKRNPGVVYCSLSVFGQEGPYSKLPGYDIIAQAMSGLMWLTGEPDGMPMRSGTSIGDVNASGYALGAIGMALVYKARTGKGQHIDVCLRDCLACELETGIIRYTMSKGKDEPTRSGAYHATMMPYGVFNAGKGRYVIVVALNENHWQALCKIMGKEEWGAQEKFKNNLQRGINQKEVIEAIEEWLQSFESHEEPIKLMQDNRIPAAPILTIPEVVNDPQFRMRNNMVEVNDPIFGPVEVTATPMIFSETSVINATPPPLLGEHTAEVLRDVLGLPEEQIKAVTERNGAEYK